MDIGSMTMDALDLAAFFDTADFGFACVRHRSGVAPVDLVAIVGVRTQDYFDTQVPVRDKRREALFPATHDVRRGDRLEVLTGPRAGMYLVEEIDQRNDGAEALATLVTPPA